MACRSSLARGNIKQGQSMERTAMVGDWTLMDPWVRFFAWSELAGIDFGSWRGRRDAM